MNAFASHFSFEFRTGIRDKVLLLMNYILPMVLYVMLGFLMTELNPFFREMVIPAMILLAILFSTIIGMPNPLLAAREAGILGLYADGTQRRPRLSQPLEARMTFPDRL